jgi:NAD(P)-dependent dehydrogenase (short-subunit alcohol dehydrogenase family)
MNNGQIVLVTGASSGIGRAAAELFAKEGYAVYGTSRRGGYETVGPKGASFTLLPMTLQDEETIRAAVQHILERHGRIDILVNAAGSGIAGPIEEMTADEVRSQFDVGFFGAMGVLRHVLPAMRAARSGRIINIGSVAAFFPLPYQGMYSAAKAALYAATCALRLELRPFGISLCQIEPGDTQTGFTERRVLTGRAKETAYREPFLRALYEMERSELAGKQSAHYARAILKAARRRRPPARICPDLGYRTLRLLSSVMPWGAAESIIISMYLKKDPPPGWDMDHRVGGHE